MCCLCLTGSAERPRSITSAYQPTSGAYALAHLVGDPAGGRSDAPGAAAAAETAAADHQHPLCSDNVVLNCQECRCVFMSHLVYT